MKLPNLLPSKVDGGALYYTLVVSILVALLTGSVFIALGMFHQIEREASESERTIRNFNSGLQLIKHANQDIPKNTATAFDLFSDGKDSVEIVHQQWGILGVYGLTSMSQHHSQKKIFFVGQEVSSESRIALLLADHNRPLSLAGNTLIKGNCILPKAGVKRAYIEGTTFKGEKLIHGQTIHSESSYNYAQLPGVEAIVSLLDEADEFEITGDSLTHSFWNKRPVHLNIEEEILQDVSIEGSVIITSEGYLEIDSSTHLEDVIVIAPSIRINQGFKGSAQFFARDSLVLEEDVTLEYPSVVMVERRNMTDQVQLHIGAGSSVSGLVCLKNSLGSKTSQSLLSTDADSKISGQVFCQGSMDHKGRVYGSVVLDRFLLRTPSSIYENHLLNATIDSRTLPANYGFLNTAGISNEPTCIAKWIH